MKPETLIYDKIRNIVPENSEKTIFYAAVTRTSYEIFFYSFIGGQAKQCYALAEEGLLDENELDDVFEAMAEIIRESKVFDADKCNIATIKLDETGIKMSMEYYDRNARMYKIEKEWERANLHSAIL